MNKIMKQQQIIERVREALGMENDADVGKVMRCNAGSVSNYRKGRRKIPLYRLEFVAEATGKSVSWLLGEDDVKIEDHNPFDEFTIVPKYKTKLSGGHGSLETSDQTLFASVMASPIARSAGASSLTSISLPDNAGPS